MQFQRAITWQIKRQQSPEQRVPASSSSVPNSIREEEQTHHPDWLDEWHCVSNKLQLHCACEKNIWGELRRLLEFDICHLWRKCQKETVKNTGQSWRRTAGCWTVEVGQQSESRWEHRGMLLFNVGNQNFGLANLGKIILTVLSGKLWKSLKHYKKKHIQNHTHKQNMR